MDVVNNLTHLQLHLIGEEWVQQAWDSDFMELDDISSDYEEFLMEKEIVNILEVNIVFLRKSMDKEDTPGSSNVSWEFLLENKVEHRRLLAVLCYFIWKGNENVDSVRAIEEGLKATSLYFLLVAIPGSDAYFVFQPSIYEKTLKTFSVCKVLYMTNECPSRGRKKQTDNDDDQDEGGDDDGNVFRELTTQERMNLRKNLNTVLRDLSLMVRRYALKVEDTLEKSIIQLISHTRLNVNSLSVDFSSFKMGGELSSFAGNSYFVLIQLCDPLHGKVDETVRILLFYLQPNILMAGDFVKGYSLQSLNNIRHHSERFVLYLLKKVKEDSHYGIEVFVQHLCARVIDKADYRLKVSQSLVALLNALPSEPYFKLIKWLLQFAHDVKASHRLFSLEVISKLLYEDERLSEMCDLSQSSRSSGIGILEDGEPVSSQEDKNSQEDTTSQDDELIAVENSPEQQRDVASHKYLLGVLFSRCYDQSGTVRTKALSTLTECLRSNNQVVASLMAEIFVQPYVNNNIIDDDNIVERGFLNTQVFLDSLDKPIYQQTNPLPGGKAVVEAILSLVEDDKVFVRKSAFQLLEYIMRLNRKWITPKLLKVMCDHCRDPALLIKKQLIQSLTDLMLRYPDDNRLAIQYIDAVLPQISHPEIKVQEKVLETLQSTILNNVVPFEKLGSPISLLPWMLLSVIIDLKRRKFLFITCSIWAKNNMLPKNLVSVIQTHINTENNIAAWLLLSCVAPYVQIKNPMFVVDYYKENVMKPEKSARYAVVKAMDVLGTAWKQLPRDEQDKLCSDLLESVRHMRLNITLIGPALDVAQLITMGQSSTEAEGVEAVGVWASDLLKRIEDYFQKNSPCQADCPKVNIEEFKRYLVTLGDIAQLCPGKVQVSIALILTGIMFPEKLRDPARWTLPGLQPLTVITLGKMCLQNECLGKRIVPALGLLLCESKDIAVKVNVLNALSDMCIRFTAVVEPLLPEMCLCLKDTNIVVRHHSVSIFVRLLQQDFLKLRGTLLFHMLSMLVDPLPSISQLANYFMTQCVVTRNKSIMYQNIVESIFYFNRYKNHAVYSKIKLTTQEACLFNMSGPENQANRVTLYRFMCEHMTDEQRMQAIHKICVDILGGVTNDTVLLSDTGDSVLRDAFLVLSCEEICLHSLRTQSEEEPATDDAERVTAAMNTAKKNLISQCVKKQVVEIIIPILVQLKAKLQSCLSPLLTNLMGYLRSILKDYKNEISEIFSEDKALGEEILFDIKQFEEQERRNRSRTQDSDDEEGEIDHMRPLLVELATDHLRQTINRNGTAEQQSSLEAGSARGNEGGREGGESSQEKGASPGEAAKSQSSQQNGRSSTESEKSSPGDKASPRKRTTSRSSSLKRTIHQAYADSSASTSRDSTARTSEDAASASPVEDGEVPCCSKDVESSSKPGPSRRTSTASRRSLTPVASRSSNRSKDDASRSTRRGSTASTSKNASSTSPVEDGEVPCCSKDIESTKPGPSRRSSTASRRSMTPVASQSSNDDASPGISRGSTASTSENASSPSPVEEDMENSSQPGPSRRSSTASRRSVTPVASRRLSKQTDGLRESASSPTVDIERLSAVNGVQERKGTKRTVLTDSSDETTSRSDSSGKAGRTRHGDTGKKRDTSRQRSSGSFSGEMSSGGVSNSSGESSGPRTKRRDDSPRLNVKKACISGKNVSSKGQSKSSRRESDVEKETKTNKKEGNEKRASKRKSFQLFYD